ncbi:hypothetical protein BGZ63DRAFT_424392 [Mariannaea sp. PMI_226]|nr:hypothetical protein BGZ63DRAFT_424392 [Mariannaea sp. PMI_226]
MAGFTLTFAPTSLSYGRSGYNKDGDDSDPKPSCTTFGRSGYNGPEADYGRSGYNKDGDDDEGNKGRSGYNCPSRDFDCVQGFGEETKEHGRS